MQRKTAGRRRTGPCPVGAALLGLALGLPAAPAWASGGSVLSASIDASSQYIWRGVLFNEDPVLQPDLALSYKHITADLWGSFDLTDYGTDSGQYRNRRGKFQELDYTVSGSWPAGRINLSAGAAAYTYPGTGWSSTRELFLSAEHAGVLSPSFAAFYDFDEARSLYLAAAARRQIAFGQKAGLTAAAGVGWADRKFSAFYYDIARSGWADLSFGLDLDYALGGALRLTPHAEYSTLLDRRLRRSVADPDVLAGGIRLAWTMR